MIVISNSLPKSGSAYLFHMTNEMIAQSGGGNICKLRIKHKDLLNFVSGANCNIKNLTKEKLERLIEVYKIENKPLTVKSHYFLENDALSIYEDFQFKTIYIYRDPRDVILSAIDHGNRLMKKNNLEGYFTRYMNVIDSTKHIEKWLSVYEEWKKFNSNTLFIKYEELIIDPFEILLKIKKFLNLELSDEFIKNIILNNTPDNAKDKDLHYNKGIAYRYQEEMSHEEIIHCNKELKNYILDMGYVL